jgi:predicted DNA-binding transcriptional regulator AlpA
MLAAFLWRLAMNIGKRQDVSQTFQLPLSTVDYFVATDQIPYYRLGKRAVRFDMDELDQWFQAGKYQRPNYERRSKQSRDGNGKFK